MNITARVCHVPLPKSSAVRINAAAQPTLMIKFNAKNRRHAIERYFPDITLGGIFIRTAINPKLSPGSRVTLRFILQNGTSYEAQGLIAWVQKTPSQQGLGIKFLHLSFASEQFFGDMLNHRQTAMVQQASQRQNALEASQKELEFCDAPTWRRHSPSLML